MTNLSRDGIHLKLDNMKFVDVISNSSDGKRTSLQSGDILISITAELGKIGWIPEGFGEAYINQHTALVRLNKIKVYSKYIAYLLASNQMNKVINRLNDSGAKSGLNLSTIGKIPVSVAPLPEQKKIAKILSTWDKAIITTEQLIANSQQQKKALMQQLLTGKKCLAGFSGEWLRYSQVGALPSYNASDLATIKTIIPSEDLEQQQIAQVLSSADQEIETLQQKLNFLKKEKKALMQQLLTGKRRVKVDEVIE